MKTNKFLVLSFFTTTCLCLFGQSKTIYIDTRYIGVKNGTQLQPFNSWSDITWKDGYVYLFKCGNILKVDFRLRPTASDITIGAYGTGTKPHFISTIGNGNPVLDLGSLKNVVIKDIEIESTNNAISCIHFFNSERGIINNCTVHGAEWGIRIVRSSGLFKIIDCELYGTGDDASFNMDSDSLEIGGTYIHNVNQKYFINPSEKFSGGDCIQTVNIKYFNIHNNRLDHSGTGNKFCFISSSTIPSLIVTGIIENNFMTRDSVKDSGDLIYLTGSKDVLIRHNIFQNGLIAIYNYSTNLIVYDNLFINQKTASVYSFADTDSEIKLFNNTFVKVNSVILLLKEKGRLINNIFYKTTGNIVEGRDFPIMNYNCHYPTRNIGFMISIGLNSIIKDPLFVNEDSSIFNLSKDSPCIGTGTLIADESFSNDANINIDKKPVTSDTKNIGASDFNYWDMEIHLLGNIKK